MADDDQIVPWEEAPLQTQEERLTAQFYAWEQRGRGWQIWDYPVALEPPFRPFLFHYVPPAAPVDDGYRPTFLSSLADAFSGASKRRKATDIERAPVFDLEDPPPEEFEDDDSLLEMEVSLPLAAKVTKEACERFLLGLAYCKYQAGFEVIGTPDAVTTQLVCRSGDLPQVRQQLQAYFPESVTTVHSGGLAELWDDGKPTVVVDFGLSREFMLPLRTFRGFDVDPLTGAVGALADLQDGELGVFQVQFQTARHPWAESIARAVTDGEGGAFFADAPQIVALAKEKISQPLFACVVRIATQSHSERRAWRIVRALASSLAQFASPASNEFIPLANDGYADEDHALDFLARRSRRSGMLLNADELVSLAHPPSGSLRVPKLKRETRKTKAAPAIISGHSYVLGENTHAERTVQVGLSADQRSRHCYLIGASGTGKSTLLLNLILQDIEQGEGVAVLDPHGDLVDELLGRIPDRRVEDVVLLDPSDEAYPVGFNFLRAHSEIEKNLLGSDLVAVFRRLSTTWGDQMTSVLGNAVLAFLESEAGGTLIDLRRFLIEPDFRRAFLKTVRDPEVTYFWEKSFPFLVGKPQGPILTRLDTFLRPKLIRYMVGQKENRLDFAGIMNEGKIFLAKLAQGMIGEENAYLLGTLLVSKFQQIAMSRQQMAAALRRDFYLYVDEFHHFVTPSMAAILSGARKYRLGLVLAHQELQQLSSRDTDVASAVIANPYTRICFRLGDFDAKKLADGFSYFEARDLENLAVGEAICRVERAEFDFNLKTFPLPILDPETSKKQRERISALSRERYATTREAVAASIQPVGEAAEVETQETEEAAFRPREQAGGKVASETQQVRKTARPEGGPERPAVPAPLPGRGGPQHKYLQELITGWAQGKGYRAETEQSVLDGRGWVDVALERGGKRIACEIAVNSTTSHELDNVQKCLAAGFDQVMAVSSDGKALDELAKAARAALSREQLRRVKFLAPERLFAYLGAQEAGEAAGRRDVPEGEEILTAREVEKLLKIDVKTIYGYVQKGLLPYIRIQSNLRFVKSEILRWMEEHQFRPKPPHKL